ncbi:hypothetical protein [uncultured Dialister sp.]|uniref:hypothetical protein n=1 Tax=uncultured Dialister sp. TaxID=278064 RepID=UPI00265EE716|nr:hypothetical protein [uncultured Dialister sp.]
METEIEKISGFAAGIESAVPERAALFQIRGMIMGRAISAGLLAFRERRRLNILPGLLNAGSCQSRPGDSIWQPANPTRSGCSAQGSLLKVRPVLMQNCKKNKKFAAL